LLHQRPDLLGILDVGKDIFLQKLGQLRFRIEPVLHAQEPADPVQHVGGKIPLIIEHLLVGDRQIFPVIPEVIGDPAIGVFRRVHLALQPRRIDVHLRGLAFAGRSCCGQESATRASTW
jgi:hypothetical protein